MDDQFGGRTDDDLFADEFEPVAEEEPQVHPVPASVPAPAANDAPAPASQTSSTAPSSVETGAAHHAQAPAATGANAAASAATTPSTTASNATAPPQKSGLMQSRHAQQPPPSAPRAPRNHRGNNQSHNNNNPSGASPSPSSPAPPSARHDTRQHKPNTGSDARTGSGANPRTKLTEAELAEKMEKMRILNEEKTRQFKKAEQDQQSHDAAMEKASADLRKRRQEEAERRRREASDKRQMDDEREKNRQRKLNALGARESNWDEGKEERLLEEDRRRGTSNFRGANGGIRGSAGGRGGGMSGSRFADPTSDTDFMSTRGGRGGRGGRGRGGRGDYSGTPPPSQAAKSESVLTSEEFPALPSASASKTKVSSVAKADLNSPTSPLGQWDDEMAAMDAKTAASTKT